MLFKEGLEDYRIPVKGIGVYCRCRFHQDNKETLFFVHGLGCSLENWRFVFEGDRFPGKNIFLFDLPGFGESEKPEEYDYTLESHGEIAGELFAFFDQVHVIAHSMGCGAALHMPGLEKALSFINLEGNLTAPDCVMSREVTAYPFDEVEKSFFKNLVRRNVFNPLLSLTRTTPRALYDTARSLVECSDNETLLSRFLAFPGKKVYIYGEKSGEIPSLARIGTIPSIKLPGCGHGMMVENPSALYDAIGDFLI